MMAIMVRGVRDQGPEASEEGLRDRSYDTGGDNKVQRKLLVGPQQVPTQLPPDQKF